MKAAQIKFMRYYVTNGEIKARVSYSLDCRIDGRKCVTLYAQDYDRKLGKIFADSYKNETDLMTDYFDKGHVTLFEDHPLYVKARIRAQAIMMDRAKKALDIAHSIKEAKSRLEIARS